MQAKEFDLLSDISITHPYAACAVFTHGFVGKWNYVSDEVYYKYSDSFSSSETIIQSHFLTNLTGQSLLF